MLDAVPRCSPTRRASWFATGEPGAHGQPPSVDRAVRHFTAADGDFVLAVGNDAQFAACCRVIGEPQLGTDDRFRTNAARVRHGDVLRDALAAAFATRTRAEWIGALTAAGVPAGSDVTSATCSGIRRWSRATWC